MIYGYFMVRKGYTPRVVLRRRVHVRRVPDLFLCLPVRLGIPTTYNMKGTECSHHCILNIVSKI